MPQHFNKMMLAILMVFVSAIAIAQRPTVPATPPSTSDTSRPSLADRLGARSGPKPYKDVITSKAVTDRGLFDVHRIEDKFFFEIGDSMLGREILVVNRISKAGAGMRAGMFGFAGDPIGQNVIRFEKGPNNKIFMRSISYSEYAKDSTSPMYMTVTKSNVQPIVAAFDIKAYSKDSAGSVIEMTEYLNSDNDILYFSSGAKSAARVGGQQPDKSYVVGVKSYPINIEITAVKTYNRTPGSFGGFPGGGGGQTAGGGNLTVELNSSIVVLPKVAMQPRYYDDRVGYFTVGYTDFDANPQGVEDIRIIKRWRLEPKDEDVEKFKRGELVEPKKPIIFYIDPATPKKWIPYLVQGINDWEPSFRKAGFKNAIVGRLAPTPQEDPEWSLEDSRYSAIVYKPSNIANASGPSISDPRSGEIMESHINWYHNVMELIHDWYFIQCAPIDTAARKMVFDDELMGQLIRFVSSHEVGHTLGLRHNYGSSSSIPVEKLRDKAWVEANGHTPSIMDYARFNYVAQPEDHIGRAGLFPRIGDYDTWAIEWGYKQFPQFKSADDERVYLNNWVIEKLKDNRLWFGTETNSDDPRSQREQVGDDAMKGSMYGIKNLQRIVPNLVQWTKQPNRDYSSLRSMYSHLVSQFNLYTGHVARYVGGIMETPRTVEEKGSVYEIVAKAKQKEAVEFLNKQLFATPAWMINNDIFDKTGSNPISTIGTAQDRILNNLLATNTLSKLIDAEARLGNNAYTMSDMFTDLKSGVWSELPARKKIDVYRRNLQKSYVDIMSGLLASPSSAPGGLSIIILIGGGSTTNINKSDIKSLVRAHLTTLRAEARAAATATSDPMSRYHLQDIVVRIDKALDPKE